MDLGCISDVPYKTTYADRHNYSERNATVIEPKSRPLIELGVYKRAGPEVVATHNLSWCELNLMISWISNTVAYRMTSAARTLKPYWPCNWRLRDSILCSRRLRSQGSSNWGRSIPEGSDGYHSKRIGWMFAGGYQYQVNAEKGTGNRRV